MTTTTCWPSTPLERSSGWRSEIRHSVLWEKPRTGLQVVRCFEVKILWAQILVNILWHLPIHFLRVGLCSKRRILKGSFPRDSSLKRGGVSLCLGMNARERELGYFSRNSQAYLVISHSGHLRCWQEGLQKPTKDSDFFSFFSLQWGKFTSFSIVPAIQKWFHSPGLYLSTQEQFFEPIWVSWGC